MLVASLGDEKMKARLFSVFALAAAVFASVPALADAQHPVVVELFQSQGCSSCPPANANLIELSKRPDILALSFGVTYWDQLGWKDTFASPQYTARQWDYARALHHSEVWTPQVVVNGRADVVGANKGEIEALISRADRGAAGPAVAITPSTVSIAAAAAPGPSAEVWLVRYDPNVVQVPIRRGENGGRTLPHKNVVHELVKLGVWTGRAQNYDIPAGGKRDLATAVLLQAGPGGAILAAAKG
jgi:hypothetical protein